MLGSSVLDFLVSFHRFTRIIEKWSCGRFGLKKTDRYSILRKNILRAGKLAYLKEIITSANKSKFLGKFSRIILLTLSLLPSL